MTDEAAPGAKPWQFWTIGIVSLLWNSMGGVDYVMTKTHNEAWLASFTPEQIAWVDNFPAWANTGWALGVWGALAGSVLLLMKRAWAFHAFAVSLVGLAIATVFQFGMGNMPESLNTGGGKAFAAVLWIIAIFLLWYAARLRKSGVLR